MFIFYAPDKLLPSFFCPKMFYNSYLAELVCKQCCHRPLYEIHAR